MLALKLRQAKQCLASVRLFGNLFEAAYFKIHRLGVMYMSMSLLSLIAKNISKASFFLFLNYS